MCLVYQSLLNSLRIKQLLEFDCPGTPAAEGQTLPLGKLSRAACSKRPLGSQSTAFQDRTLSSWYSFLFDFWNIYLWALFFSRGIIECFVCFFILNFLKGKYSPWTSWVLTFFPPHNWQTNWKILYQLQIWTN